MTDILNTLLNLFVMIFVLASMFGLGLGLTLKQVWAPLRNIPLILKSLAANFILVPLLALLLVWLFGLDQWLAAGLFVMAVVAGAPIPFHWIVTDNAGKSIVVEYIDGQLHLHDNKIGVMTNSPGYDWHLLNLRNYVRREDIEDRTRDFATR